MESTVKDLMNNGIDVQLLVPSPKDDLPVVGVRLHPYGRDLPKNKMVLGVGATFAEALDSAVEKAVNGRWENLDWADRPWDRRPSRAQEAGATYGLL